MALPTTNLTFHADASTNAGVWEFYQSGTPFHNTPAIDNHAMQVWDDADGKDLSLVFMDANNPKWMTTTPVMALPNLDFSLDYFALWNHAATAPQSLGSVITAAAFLAVVSFRIDSVASTADNTTPYQNDAIFADGTGTPDPGGFWGIHLRNNAGAYTVQLYNFTSAVNCFSMPVAINTDYVLLYWHTGGTIFAELHVDNSGTPAQSGSIASGATSAVSHQFVVGRNGIAGTIRAFDGRIGEIAIYNAYNATDKTAARAYFTAKWTPAGGGGPGLPTLSGLTPNSAYVNPTVPVKLVGVTFSGTGLDGTGGAFDPVSGFTFSNLSIVSGGAAGTVDIQIVAGKATGTYNFTYTTSGGSSIGTSAAVAFTVLSPTGGTAGDTGSVTQFNVGFN